MNFVTKHKKLWLGLGIPSLVLLVVWSIGYPIASNYQGVINQVLHVNTTEIVKDTDSSQDTEYFKSNYNTKEDLQNHEMEVIAQEEEEGACLLRNNLVDGEPALPLASGAKVSLFSQSSVRPVYGGTGSGQVNVASAPTFKDALAEEGITANPNLWNFYESGDGSSYSRKVPSTTESKTEDFWINEVPWSRYGKAVKNSFSSYGDAAIVTIARAGGEGCDLAIDNGSDALDGDYLKLNQDELDMMAQLKAYKEDGTFKKIIVLLNTSNMVSLDFLDDYDVDAVLWIGDIGGYGINGVARILSGKVNPSGRTVETYLKDNHASPTFYNQGIHYWSNIDDYISTLGDDPMGKNDYNNNAYVVYQEGIYVGYRYYETRYYDTVVGQGNPGDYDYSSVVAYPFGTGLSYSEFTYSGFTMTEGENDTLNFKVTVTNTGSVAGKHTVELYMNAPYTQGGIEKAASVLVGFDKTDTLAAGESQEISIDVAKRDLCSYDKDEAKTYVLEKGDYLFTVASDAHAATNNFLAKNGYTPSSTSNRMDDEGDASMVTTYNQAETDTETYSVSPYSGNKITNQLDDVDVLKYDGIDSSDKSSFHYLSRSDWEGTFPTEAASLKVTDQMLADGLNIGKKTRNDTYKALVEEMKAEYQEREGEVKEMPTTGADNGLTVATLMNTDIETPEGEELWNKLADQMTVDEMISLVTQGFHQTNGISSIGLPATKDENGPQGLTASLIGGTSALCFTSEDILAATYNRDLANDVGTCLGEDCLYGGYSGMYAPGANIHRSAYEGRSFEYYSEDGFLSGEMADQECQGISSMGVLVQMKHFVLNDQESYRTGIATFANEQAMREIYLKPFEGAIADKGPLVSVMTSFNRLGVRWSSSVSGLMRGILVDEWHCQGSNITDCSTNLDYMDGVLGLLGGTTLWDGAGTNCVYTITDYSSDPVVVDALKKAALRVAYSYAHTNAMNGISSTDKIIVHTPWYLNLLIALIVIFAVLTATFATLYILAIVFAKKEKPAVTE